MTPVVTQPAAPPADPVRIALEDAEVRDGLLAHARAILGRWLASRPAAVRDEVAAEAVQDAQLRAIQKCQGYAPAAGSVPAWLHGILNNVLRETARKLQRQPAQLPANEATWDRLDTEAALPAGEAVPDRLAAAEYLDRLPTVHREVLQLRLYEKLDHDEIATRLGISPGNARVRLSRALKAVRDIAGVSLGEDRP